MKNNNTLMKELYHCAESATEGNNYTSEHHLAGRAAHYINALQQELQLYRLLGGLLCLAIVSLVIMNGK